MVQASMPCWTAARDNDNDDDEDDDDDAAAATKTMTTTTKTATTTTTAAAATVGFFEVMAKSTLTILQKTYKAQHYK